MPVATKTQSVTNTKLALATAALLAASGLALAFLPGSGLGEKCGVNAARYANDRACPGSSTNSIEFTCLGDKKKKVRSISGRCVNPKEYKKAANKECCNAPTGRCGDSDGGLNTEVAGGVEYEIRSSEMVEVVDRCDTRDPNRILEGYCAEDGEGKISRLPCRDGSVCQDRGRGAKCVASEPEPVEITCEDSDSEIQGEVDSYDYSDPMSYFVSGTVRVSGMNDEVSDWCSASGLLEMYCQEDGSFLNHHVTCETYGATCQSGACVCPEGSYQDPLGRCVTREACIEAHRLIVNDETRMCLGCEGDTVANSDSTACVCPEGHYLTGLNSCWSQETCRGADNMVTNEETGECRVCEGDTIPNSGSTACVCPGGQGFNVDPNDQGQCECQEGFYLDQRSGSCISEHSCTSGADENNRPFIANEETGECHVCEGDTVPNSDSSACEETPGESQQREGLSQLQDTSTCIDSDSNILNLTDLASYFVTGTVSGIDVGGNGYEYSDFCTSGRILGEVYCDNSNGTLLGNTSQVNCENYGATCEIDGNGLGSCACPPGQEFDPETEECSL
tara:strand:- start:120 stop:1808 length:1689 start_codon:yes stop_codon:yes gene_type:complete